MEFDANGGDVAGVIGHFVVDGSSTSGSTWFNRKSSAP